MKTASSDAPNNQQRVPILWEQKMKNARCFLLFLHQTVEVSSETAKPLPPKNTLARPSCRVTHRITGVRSTVVPASQKKGRFANRFARKGCFSEFGVFFLEKQGQLTTPPLWFDLPERLLIRAAYSRLPERSIHHQMRTKG